MNAIVDVTNKKLETERVIIRPWKKEDLEDFYEYARVDGVGQRAGWNPHASIQESEEILASFIQEKTQYAIELKENDKVIGSIGIEELSLPLDPPYDNYIGRELGYVLSKAYWGKGIMPEAVKRVIQDCFEVEHYDFLLCSHSITNEQSKRVIEKCGFRFLTDHSRTTIRGGIHESKYYVLDNENR